MKGIQLFSNKGLTVLQRKIIYVIIVVDVVVVQSKFLFWFVVLLGLLDLFYVGYFVFYNLLRCFVLVCSAPELEAHVRFCVRLLSIIHPSVCSSVNISLSHLLLLLSRPCKRGIEHPWVTDSILFKWRTTSFSKRREQQNSKKQWPNLKITPPPTPQIYP